MDSVTLSLAQYNTLRDENAALKTQNSELEDALEALKENDGQKVIIRESCTCEDEEGEETVCVHTWVKGFDEVKAEVEEFYKKKIEDLETEIEAKTKAAEKVSEELLSNAESQKQTADALAKKALEAEMEVSRLKHRNLWKRILNK